MVNLIIIIYFFVCIVSSYFAVMQKNKAKEETYFFRTLSLVLLFLVYYKINVENIIYGVVFAIVLISICVMVIEYIGRDCRIATLRKYVDGNNTVVSINQHIAERKYGTMLYQYSDEKKC